MAVRLVILDLDRTLWDHHNATELRAPFTRIDEQTVADATGVHVTLQPGARALLDTLRERRILISIASWNQPAPASAILETLGLRDYFVHPKVEFHPYKERTVSDLVRELSEEGVRLRPEEILYVDDRALHLRRVRRAVGPVQVLQAGVDIRDLRDVIGYLDRDPASTHSPVTAEEG
ncbi:MAG: magnesium-dependent phosphatase-1 [Armatimonadetes bacterium 13_1_40CM_64_14]|nr:MAG: magnesium-dependent phosphatase-1 [Armatimonadetes bacterium 13_1_40CM_64_14]